MTFYTDIGESILYELVFVWNIKYKLRVFVGLGKNIKVTYKTVLCKLNE